MELGLNPDLQMAIYLGMNVKDETQLNVARVMQSLVDKKDVSKDQLQLVLSYIRELDLRCGMYNLTLND